MHRLTRCTLFYCLTTSKYGLGQNSTKFEIWTWGFSGIVVYCFRRHLNLPKIVSLLMLHLLPCLTTFNIVGYINGRELNKWKCGVSSICNSLHIELHLTCSIVCCTLFSCLTTLKYGLGQNSTESKICIWGFSEIVVCCFGPHLNLPK